MNKLRRSLFGAGCAAIAAGVLLHLPMLAMAHAMGNRLSGMETDGAMLAGMALIALGVPLACYGALPGRGQRATTVAPVIYEAPDETPLGRWHAVTLLAMTLALIIDTMKPATLGFVLPGLRREYGVSVTTAALLPLVALIGTTIGSFVWGWLADAHGRRVTILLSTILFVATSICGAMPSFAWNMAMCFAMGLSAGGMLPVVYALLAEIMPPRHRSWVLVLVGGIGLVGGLLAASTVAWLLEPVFGWRALWLLGFPTGLLLLALAPLIPESPRFLAAAGDARALARVRARYGIVALPATPRPEATAHSASQATARNGLMIALALTALAWSLVNFGVLLWLPSDLGARGFSAAIASALLARSALIALPVIALVAALYSRWSAKWTFVLTILLLLAGLLGALLPPALLGQRGVLFLTVALLVVGTNGLIAVLLPYAAESYPLGQRGRVTGLVAGSSKFGGVAVQAGVLAGIVPTLAGLSGLLTLPIVLAAAMVAILGRETRGKSLGALETQAIG